MFSQSLKSLIDQAQMPLSSRNIQYSRSTSPALKLMLKRQIGGFIQIVKLIFKSINTIVVIYFCLDYYFIKTNLPSTKIFRPDKRIYTSHINYSKNKKHQNGFQENQLVINFL